MPRINVDEEELKLIEARRRKFAHQIAVNRTIQLVEIAFTEWCAEKGLLIGDANRIEFIERLNALKERVPSS